jgi:hypothetical protein
MGAQIEDHEEEEDNGFDVDAIMARRKLSVN